MRRRRHSLCFVDDDPAELRRFRENLKSEFVIGVGRTLDDALADLKKNGRERPDLFVLDLYFSEGPLNNEAELSELRAAWDRYKLAQADFMAVLAKLRQTSHGGLTLAEDVWQRYHSRNYVFFTRKATLEEGLMAINRGRALRIMKKPDAHPAEAETRTLTEAYDSAFRDKAHEIASELRSYIRRTSWWWKHRESVWSAIIAFILGYGASVLANVTPALLKEWLGR
jgi:DNA-binding NarL/FixJ family response regulator